MRRTMFDRNLSIGDRIAKLELVVSDLYKKAVGATSTGLITPYPISNAVSGEDVRGSILRYLFPCNGTVIKGMIRFGAKPKSPVSLIVLMKNEMGGISKVLVVDKKLMSTSLDFKVLSGDCLDISIESQEPITEVWISFLWIPSVTDIEARSFLIDELERSVENASQDQESREQVSSLDS